MARRPVLAMVCGGLLVSGAQAALVQAPTDLLHTVPGAATAPVGKTLERALDVDTNAGQRNLTLLLEARDVAEPPSAVPARAGDLPVKRQTAVLPQPRLPAAAGLPDRDAPPPIPGLQATGAANTADTATRREWLGSVSSVQGGGAPGPAAAQAPFGGDPDPASTRTVGRAAGVAEPGQLADAIQDTLRFLRENRFPLLGGVVLLAAVAAGLQAYARRP